MRLQTIDSESYHSESHVAWRWFRHCLKCVRDWPEKGDNPYSLLLCLSLLVAVGLIVKIGH